MYSENLKKIRKELKYTAAEMADILGVNARTYGSWERKEKTPSIELCTQLNVKLNINLNWFVTGKGGMFNKSESETNPVKAYIRTEILNLLIEEGVIKS